MVKGNGCVWQGTAISLLLFYAVAQGGESLPARPAVSVQAASQLASFQLERGYRLELVAGESMVASPAAMAFDENGRLFVAEMRDYPDRRAQIPHLGRVRMLEDSDGDGVFDVSTVYADNLPWPSAIACYGGGVFVGVTPEILYFKDQQHNGVADVRKVVFTGFGPASGQPDRDALLNSFVWGLDNRIHGGSAGIGGLITAIAAPGTAPVLLGRHDFSFDPRALTLAIETGQAATGLTMDNFGRKYWTDSSHPLAMSLFEARYFARNPYASKPPEWSDVAPPVERIFRYAGEARLSREGGRPGTSTQPALIVQGSNMLATTWMSKPRGSLVYRDGMSNRLATVFIADPEAHVIHRLVLTENGLEVSAQRAGSDKNTEFLISKDPSFRPAQIIAGPEGALYIADIQNGGDSGRIFRIVPDTFKQGRPPQLGKAKTHEVVALLAHTNSWLRDTAARLLYERRDPASVAPAIALLTNMVINSRLAQARLDALRALDGLGGLNDGLLLKGLRDPDEHVREQAVALTEKMMNQGKLSNPVWERLRSMTEDSAIRVRLQLAFTLGEVSRAERAMALAEVLDRDATNQWFQAAALSSVMRGAADLMATLAGNVRWRNDPRGTAFLRRLAIEIGVKGQKEEVAQALDFISRAKMEPEPAFVLLDGVGEGLHQLGSSLALVDPEGLLQPFYDQSLAIALDSSFPDSTRIAALALRGVSPFSVTGPGDIFQLLFGSGQSEAVQAAALATMGRYDNPAIATNIIGRWSELSPPLRRQTINVLLARVDRVGDIISALEDGRIAPTDFTSTQVEFLRAYRDGNLRSRALRFFGPSTRGRPGMVERFRGTARVNGLAVRGREIFRERCSSCHRLGGEGVRVGPDLAAGKLQGKERLLSAILEPNAQINPAYITSVVVTRRHENLIGIVEDENPTTITLRQAGGGELVWPRSNIETIEPQPWSLMPEGLEQGLAPESMADLLEYLMTAPR